MIYKTKVLCFLLFLSLQPIEFIPINSINTHGKFPTLKKITVCCDPNSDMQVVLDCAKLHCQTPNFRLLHSVLQLQGIIGMGFVWHCLYPQTKYGHHCGQMLPLARLCTLQSTQTHLRRQESTTVWARGQGDTVYCKTVSSR